MCCPANVNAREEIIIFFLSSSRAVIRESRRTVCCRKWHLVCMLPKTRSDQSRPLAQRMSSLFPLLALSVYVSSRRCPIRAGDHGFRGVGEPQNHRTYGVCVTYPKVLSAPVGEAPVHTHEKNDETADGVNDASSADTSEATAPVAEPPAVAPTPGPEKAGTGGMPGSSPPRGVRRRGRRGGGPGGRDGSGGGRTDVQVRSFFPCAFFCFFGDLPTGAVYCRGYRRYEAAAAARRPPKPGVQFRWDPSGPLPSSAVYCHIKGLVGWLVCCTHDDGNDQRPQQCKSRVCTTSLLPQVWGCYCLLTRLPFFDLHFQVLWDLLAAERIMRMKVHRAPLC